jgi:hypothetical protein
MNPTRHDIVFFDGECGLCHAFVKFVVRHDPAAQFLFAPLRGETFRQCTAGSDQDRAGERGALRRERGVRVQVDGRRERLAPTRRAVAHRGNDPGRRAATTARPRIRRSRADTAEPVRAPFDGVSAAPAGPGRALLAVIDGPKNTNGAPNELGAPRAEGF